MTQKTAKGKRGGARPGAGRPRGSLNRRSVEAIEKVAEQFPDWSPLQHFAAVANNEELDDAIRLDAAKAAAPFIHPRPKSVELDPEALVDLEARLVQVRLEAQDKLLLGNPGLADRLQRAKERVVVVESNAAKVPDNRTPAPTIDGLAAALERAETRGRLSPPEKQTPPPERAAAPEKPAAPPPPAPYAPINLPTMSEDYSPFSSED